MMDDSKFFIDKSVTKKEKERVAETQHGVCGTVESNMDGTYTEGHNDYVQHTVATSEGQISSSGCASTQMVNTSDEFAEKELFFDCTDVTLQRNMVVDRRLNFEGEGGNFVRSFRDPLVNSDNGESFACAAEALDNQKKDHSDVCTKDKTCEPNQFGEHASKHVIGEQFELEDMLLHSETSQQSSDEHELLPDSSDTTAESSSSSSDTSVDTEESDEFGGYTVNRVDSDDGDRSAHNTDDQAIANDPVEQNEVAPTFRRLERSRRKRLHSFIRRSSSSDNAASDSDGSNNDEMDIEAKVSHIDDETAAASVTTAVKDSWQLLLEVFCRQIGGHRSKNRTRAMFTGRYGGSVHVASRLMLYDKHEVHNGCVNALNFNESGSLIASGSDDLKVVVFDWVKKRTYISFDTGHRSNVFQAKFLPHTGDCHIVTCARDGQVRLAQLSTTGSCNRTKRLAAHRQAAHKLAILNDSPHIFYSCGEDSVVFKVDLRQEQPVKCYSTKENDRGIPLYSIHANPSNSYEHCVGGRDQYIRVYDTRMIDGNDDKRALLKKFCPHHLLSSDYKAHITCAVYNYNGSEMTGYVHLEIIGSYNDDDIYSFDSTHSDGAQHVHKYSGHRNNATVKGVNFFGPKSEFVVSGSDCGNVFLWHQKSEQIVNYFHADDGGVVNVLEPHPHFPILATSGLDNDFKLWMPTAPEPSALSNLQKVVRKNEQEREEDRNEPDVIDSQMLWFLMHTLRRNAARRANAAAGAAGVMFSGISDSDQSAADTDGPDNGGDEDSTDNDNDDVDDADRPSDCTTS